MFVVLETVDPDQIATPERTEQLRRSMAMLNPGQQSWLTRDDALMILEALENLQRWALGRTCCQPDDGPSPVSPTD